MRSARFTFVVAATLCAGASYRPAQAQQANPAPLAPRLQPAPSGGFGVGPAPADVIVTPPGAENVFVTVRSVSVDGAFPELAAQSDFLIAQIKGQRVTLARVYDFARALDEVYTAVYPLARVKVPPQDFRAGVVRLEIVDGFIESVDVDKVPEKARPLVLGRLEPIVDKRHVTRDEIQRRILLLGDIAGISGGSSGRRGVTPGGSVLVIEATEKPWTAATATDNRLPKQLGTWEFIDSAAVSNFFGFGEQFYGTVASTSDFGRFFDGRAKYEAYGGGASAPIGFDGLKAETGFIAVRQRPTPLDGAYPIEQVIVGQRTSSRFQRAYLNLMYPLFLTVRHSLRLQATFDYTDEQLVQGPAPVGFALPVGFVYSLYRDRYAAFRIAGEWAVQHPWEWGGRAVLTAIYSHGLGGRTAWEAPFIGTPLSRPGSWPTFDRLYVDARIVQPLPFEFEGLFVARAQTSFGAPLMLAEQLSLDGLNALSGFAAGTINVDRGVTLRSELARTFSFDFGLGQSSITPYVFGAWGRGVREWPFYLSEVGTVEGESYGGGLRAGAAITGLPFGETISVEFAKSHSNLPYRENGYRTNFSFVIAF
jgi:hemolysin activation/secretion protein